MIAIITRLRSVWETTRPDVESSPSGEDHQVEPSAEQPRAGLYHCPTCDVVYLATDKQTCSECRGAVEEVRRTPTRR